MAGRMFTCVLFISSVFQSVAAKAPTQPGSQAADSVLPGSADATSERLVQWGRENGAEVNIAIRTVPGKGRGIYAPKAFAVGDVMVRIPVEMTFANSDRTKPEEVVAARLLAGMASKDSPMKPFYDAQPQSSELFSSVKLPVSYLPVIQDPKTEYTIRLSQFEAEELWRQSGEAYWKSLGPNLTLKNLTHAVSLLRTRMFRFETADVMIPIVEMANHLNDCLHSSPVPEPCDPEQGNTQWATKAPPPPLAATIGSGVFGLAAAAQGQLSGQCLVWRAATPVAAGEELCICYGKSLQDRMVLQYGFLEEGRIARELSMMDKNPAYQPREYWFAKFLGTLSQVWAEIDRLTWRLVELQNGDAAAEAVQPDASIDPSGWYLSQLKKWRSQRHTSIQLEIIRLYKEADKMKRGFDRWLAREVPGGAAAVAWSTELAAAGISSGSPVRGPHVPGADYLGVSAADAYYDMGIPAGDASKEAAADEEMLLAEA